MSFEIALGYTLKFEGGYVNNPVDPGGATNKGITQSVYDAYRVQKNLPKQHVKLIFDTEVKEIYLNQYWNVAGCDKLEDKLSIVVFDAAVNHGPGRAKKWLMITTDPKKYLDIRQEFFKKIVANKPSQSIFLKGWLNRVEGLRKIIA